MNNQRKPYKSMFIDMQIHKKGCYLPSQSWLMVFITLQVVKTEYFPCDLHFFVLNMTKKA